MGNGREGGALGSEADRSNTQGVPSSDKLDNKLDDKPNRVDCELALIVQAWSKLPEAIRSAILAIVRQAAEGNMRETDQRSPNQQVIEAP